jgi:hypothetical protein
MKKLAQIFQALFIVSFIALVLYTGFHLCKVEINLFSGL